MAVISVAEFKQNIQKRQHLLTLKIINAFLALTIRKESGIGIRMKTRGDMIS